MWCNKKYKLLKRISNYGNLKVQNMLLKWWRAINNDLHQQLKFTDSNYEWRDKYSLTMWVQYKISAKYLYECAAKTTCKRPLRQLKFLQRAVFNDGKLVFKCQFLQKNHPYVNATNHNVKLQIFLSFPHFLIMPFLLLLLFISSSICIVHVISSILLTCHSSFSAFQIFSLLSLSAIFFFFFLIN